MSKIDESIGFYRKMSDLQERLRRSEEERLQLEEKFALLMRACRDEEEARLSDLREQYETFLEDEKRRRERNDRILQTLDRIESRAAILTAKSERLQLLRRHYEAYMLRMYPGWKYVTDKFSQVQIPKQKFDPIHNKLHLEADRNFPYNERSSSALMTVDFAKRDITPRLPHSYVSIDRQPVLGNRTVHSAPITRDMPILGTALPTVILNTSKESSVDGVREHVLAKKPTPSFTQDIINSSQTKPDTGSVIVPKKINQIDDYLGRTAEMLKMSRTPDNLRDKNWNMPASEINPDSLKDSKFLGNSLDFELEQNTSGDLLNVSLSDDGILQEETNRTPANLSRKDAENRNIKQTELLNVNDAASKNEKDEDFNQNLRDTTEIIKETDHRIPILESAISTNREVVNNQNIHLKNATLIGGGDSIIPDENRPIYPAEEVLKLDEKNNKKQILSHSDGGKAQERESTENIETTEQYSDELLNVNKDGVDGLKREGFNANGDGKNEDTSEVKHTDDSSYSVEVQPDQENEVDEQKNVEAQHQPDQENEVEEQQWDENDPQYYQQYAEQQGQDQYYQYGDDDMYAQQYAEGEYDLQYQQEDQYQQYLDQEEGQYDQQYTEQQAEEYQKYMDEYKKQYGEYYTGQEGEQYDEYMEQQAGQQYAQYDQYAAQGEFEEQHEDKKDLQEQQEGTRQTELHKDEKDIKQLNGDQQQLSDEHSQKDDRQGNKRDADVTEVFETGKDHEQTRTDELDKIGVESEEETTSIGEKKQSNVIKESTRADEEMEPSKLRKESAATLKSEKPSEVEGGSITMEEEEKSVKLAKGNSVAKEEKKSSDVVEEKTESSTVLSHGHKVSNVPADLSPPLENMEQYRKLLGETGEPEQSDSDELEVQLAALVEPKRDSESAKKQPQQPALSGEKVVKQMPAAVPSFLEDVEESTTSTDTSINKKELIGKADVKVPQIIGSETAVTEMQEPLAKIPNTLQEREIEPKVKKTNEQKEEIKPKVTQQTRPGSKKLPDLTKMLESDTESLQLDATISNEDSDDFDFSSNK